jgi:hypothetical protein
MLLNIYFLPGKLSEVASNLNRLSMVSVSRLILREHLTYLGLNH